MEYWIPAVLMAVIYSAMGRFVAHYPETKSGYSTMSAERKKYVDIQAAGRCVARFFTAAGYIRSPARSLRFPAYRRIGAI